MAAVLLPFDDQGHIAEAAFQHCVQETFSAGLTPAVNMDTGYVNLLDDSEKLRVLDLTREVSHGRSFVAGAFIEGADGDIVELYQRQMDHIVGHGGTPILFQTSRTHAMDSKHKVEVYARAVKGLEKAYAFELGRMFAPNGEIWDLETFERIIQIPEIIGAKHSSLDRTEELRRLEIRDRIRPEFKVLTGNDLGIDMVEFGSDYLLGLATFAPSKFAERDRYWTSGDARYLEIADSLQFLGNLAFRPPVPAYKHSAAIFLHMTGKIPTSQTHPRSAKRPSWEAEVLAECARRLGLLQ